MAKKTYFSVLETADRWNIPVRSVRQYCLDGRIPGATKKDGEWQIPADTTPPVSSTIHPNKLLEVLQRENNASLSGGIYHKVQIELTYNSNHIEGSTLTHDQTRLIFETNTIFPDGKLAGLRVNDIVETANHFRCVDYIIDNANRRLSANMVKTLHFILKNGTSDSLQKWFSVGDYKKIPNEVGGLSTTAPDKVDAEVEKILRQYNSRKQLSFDDLLDFHYKFERIHPFQDGNGRVGRLILFKECLRLGIVPFIIDEELKLFYYRGLKEWRQEPGYLRDTCLRAQDKFKNYLDYFEIYY